MAGFEDEPSRHRRVVSVSAAVPGREFIRVVQKTQFTSPSLCSCQLSPAHQRNREGKSLPLLWNQVMFKVASNSVMPGLVEQREIWDWSCVRLWESDKSWTLYAASWKLQSESQASESPERLQREGEEREEHKIRIHRAPAWRWAVGFIHPCNYLWITDGVWRLLSSSREPSAPSARPPAAARVCSCQRSSADQGQRES